MTQQDIVIAVNSLAVGNHINWQDIMYDADRAIDKINARLGAKYPRMSDIMLSPESTYSIKIEGKYIPIFDQRYIRTVVIPFIASEILARDEEFTTIYNKYTLDVEEGLYDMFSNEFNRIPEPFKQDSTTGVFFPKKTLARNVFSSYGLHTQYVGPQCCDDKPMELKLHVHYNVNSIDLVKNNDFIEDNTGYDFNTQYTLKSASGLWYSSFDGTTAYVFDGWCKDAMCIEEMPETVTLISDLEVYAKWNKVNTFSKLISSTSCYPVQLGTYCTKSVNLVVPEFIDGYRVNTLNNNVLHSSNVVEFLTIPSTITHIQANTLNNFKGRHITFPQQGNITVDAGGLVLTKNCKLLTNDEKFNQYDLVITPAIKSIDTDAFGYVIPAPSAGCDYECDLLVMYNGKTDNIFPSLINNTFCVNVGSGTNAHTIKYTVTFNPNYRGD